MSILNFEERYEKYKPILIDVLTECYNREEEFKNTIREHIDSCYKNFSSTPKEEYLYATRDIKRRFDLSYEEAKRISFRYHKHINVEINLRDKFRKRFTDYLISQLPIKNTLDYEEKRLLFSLFASEDFDTSFIDLFNNEKIFDSIHVTTTNYQEKFGLLMNRLGIAQTALSPNTVDNIIEFRKEIQTEYRHFMAKDTEYGQEIEKEFAKKFNVTLKPEFIYSLGFLEYPHADVLIASKKEKYFRYIRMPILMLKNRDNKNLDHSFIHELIHIIENNGACIGICDANGNNKIANELRTEKLATKVTQLLHQLGIFIFDTPLDYTDEGQSVYEYLFPIFDEFYNKYENILIDCAINNNMNQLNEYFGTSWKEYSNYIDCLFQYLFYYIQINQPFTITMTEEVAHFINEMNISYSKRKR